MSFKGFEDNDIDPKPSTSHNSSSSSGASEYETVTDINTTPTASPYSSKVSTVQKKKQERTSVRQLIDHFSSDSDTTADQSRARRRRSIAVEHIELPPGGEKQIKKNMADQKRAVIT